MKTSVSIITTLLLAACSSNESKGFHKPENNRSLKTETCACENSDKEESVVYTTKTYIKGVQNNVLEFRCISVLKGTASVSDTSGNNEQCITMYSIQCVSSANKSLPLSEKFEYFTDKLQPQAVFFEDIKSKENYYFELSLDPEKKITSISRLKMD